MIDLQKQEIEYLEELSLNVREHIIRMSTDGGCFIGASLSCTDLLVFLYSRVLRITPETVNDANRDYFFLSKGHDVPALYGTLAELGFIDHNRLQNHLKMNDSIYWHPNRTISGIEFHSGSLGHLLSVAIGVAIDIKLRGGRNNVYVLLGDGELNEGSIWEGMLIAASKKLDNLIAIVDRNEFQANVRTEDLIPLEPLESKFEAFGWRSKRINGHDFIQMASTFASFPFQIGMPSIVIANTVRGRGLPSIEARVDRWFVNLTQREVDMLIDELHGNEIGQLTSDPLIVR